MADSIVVTFSLVIQAVASGTPPAPSQEMMATVYITAPRQTLSLATLAMGKAFKSALSRRTMAAMGTSAGSHTHQPGLSHREIQVGDGKLQHRCLITPHQLFIGQLRRDEQYTYKRGATCNSRTFA